MANIVITFTKLFAVKLSMRRKTTKCSILSMLQLDEKKKFCVTIEVEEPSQPRYIRMSYASFIKNELPKIISSSIFVESVWMLVSICTSVSRNSRLPAHLNIMCGQPYVLRYT